MAKEIMIFTADEIKTPAALTPTAVDAYRFALEKAGVDMDEQALQEFISARNAKANGFSDLWEFKSWCEKVAESIKEVCKHAFNVGTTEELPKNVSWKKGGGKYKFKPEAGHIIGKSLVSRKLTTTDKLLDQVTPSAMASAANMKVEGLMEMFPDTIIYDQNQPSLVIK